MLANWVGLQNKDRWQWIAQMFHCGKAAICCAFNTIGLLCHPTWSYPTWFPYNSHTTCCPAMGLCGMKGSVAGDHCSISYGNRMVWGILYIQFSRWYESMSGQVPFTLKSLEVAVTLKWLIEEILVFLGNFWFFSSKHEVNQVNSNSEFSRSPSVPDPSLTKWHQSRTRLNPKCKTTACTWG